MLTPRGSALVAAMALCALTTPLTGCLERPLAQIEPRTQTGVFEEIRQTGTTKVDLVFVIDNSNSMGEEQAVLSQQIEDMARQLTSPSPIAEGAVGVAVEDLHIGIITSDMGTGGHRVTTCDNPMQGDNGVLQNMGRYEGCGATYGAQDCTRAECPWLVHSASHPDDGREEGNPPIWEDFACIGTLGTGGCGFEQQLESSLVALTTQSEPGRPNEGFLRDDSLLAIIYVTDEDDCSAANPEIYNSTRTDLGPPNTRCALGGQSLLHPVSRYYDGFRALRPGREELVVVAAITGVPIDGRWSPGDSIDSLRELVQVDPSEPNNLLPSCDTAMGFAYPPVRIAELVYMFENNGILESICRSDWTAALQSITSKIQMKLLGACIARELPTADPDVCRVIETLVDDRPCPNPAESGGSERTGGWQLDLGLDEDGRRQCEILPSDYDADGRPDGTCDPAVDDFEGCLEGWYYQAYAPEFVAGTVCEHGQVRFTSRDVTSDLSDVRFECNTALCPERRQCGDAALSAEACDPTDIGSCGAGRLCVRHSGQAVCGDAATCGRCSETVGALCSVSNEYWAVEPLVQAGGCCHEGFHCEEGSCQPNRTTLCD